MKKLIFILLFLMSFLVRNSECAAQTDIITTAVNGTNSYAFGGDGGPAILAWMGAVTSIRTDATGNLYFADMVNHRIRKVNTAGIITTVAGSGPVLSIGSGSFSGDGGAATAARLNRPDGIAADGSGNLYINDGGNARIRKVSNTGVITTIAGNGTGSNTGDGGPASASSVIVSAICADAAGNVYFSYGTIIRKIDASTGIISRYAGTGTAGYSGDGGPATAAAIATSRRGGLATDNAGNLYVSDDNNRIRKIDATGIITTIAGIGTTGYSGDGGPATAAALTVAGLDVDNSGNVFFAEAFRYAIRKIDAAGIITTITAVSSFPQPCTGDGGPATAVVGSPSEVCTDGNGKVYVHCEYSIRMIGSNRAPRFAGGHTHVLTVCGNSAGDSINSLLAVNDTDNNQQEIWSIVSAPVHGTAVVSDTMTSTGLTMTPAGLYYRPTPGYTGNDTMRIRVTDGYAADTTTIYITVAAPTAAITGTTQVCAGLTTTLGSATPGGTWSSSNTTFAGVGSASGIVTGVSAGTATITYSAVLGCGLSAVTTTVTVNPYNALITATSNLCVGSANTAGNSIAGGVWTSGATGIADIGSATGTVTGVGAGVAAISYTLPTGCTATTNIAINPLPGAITGIMAACAGLTSPLSSSSGGGVWISGTTGIASIGSASGIVTGVSPGTATITYTLPTGCRTTGIVTVNTAPGPVTGVAGICPGDLSILSNGVAGGTWISRDPAIAIIDISGIVTGVVPGTVQMIYSMGAGCADSLAMTVYAAPAPITGSPNVCIGMTSALSDATPGGTWSSSAPGTASVGTTGIVTGLGFGTSDIYYSTGGCPAIMTVTVNPAPAAITGVSGICVGASTTLSNTVTGGVWSSGNPAVATINSSGTYTGLAAGTATMSYSTGAGCTATFPITIYALPAAITGTLNICPAMSTTLSSATSGGTWSASGSAATIIGSTGVVTGVSTGTSIISYTTGSSCRTTAIVTVNPLPAAISGLGRACPGTSTLLGITTPGGVWSSAIPGIATVGSVSGSVTGVATGTVSVVYTLPTGCSSTKVVTINPLPVAITGASSVCVGQSVTLISGTGGTWSRSNTNITIGTTSGIVTGVNAGTSVVTYTLPTGCYVTKTITINSSPGTIGGAMQVCAGSSTSLTVTPGGSGAWSSGSLPIATIGSSSGIVSGVAAGTAGITYSVGTGCAATATVTVHALPGLFTVTGGGSYCAGGVGVHIGLSGSATGVNYQLYLGTVATGTPLAGTGAPLDFGLLTATGIYTVVATSAQGCTSTMTGSVVIAINPLPGPIGGPSAVCVGSNITLTNTGGGTWLSGTPATATIGSTTGIVSGVAIGTTTVTYTLPTTCEITKTITVSSTPTAIIGPSTVCAGASATLTVTPAGGMWSSPATTVAVGSLSGVVTGVAAGPATVTYSLGTGCAVTKTMTVLASPAAIGGSSQVCVGGSTSLTMTTTGGTWSSGGTGVATVTGTGVVSGVSAGTAVISYTAGGCSSTKVMTVNTIPSAITGPGAVCVGDVSALSVGAGSGGVWTSGSTGVATIGSSSGIVSGVSGGTTIITYSLGTGLTACSVTRTITVNAAPVISGATGVCVGSTSAWSVGAVSGTWSSGATGIATVSTTGSVTGVSAGTAAITFTPATGCIATKTMTVNTTPGAITGTAQVCAGASTTLSVTSGSGGVWTSGSTIVATVGSLSGVVNGVAAGVATITYSLGTGCTVAKVVTVNPLPTPITGGATVCIASSTSLTVTSGGGVWSSGSTGIATVTTLGVVTGAATGTATISYTLTTGCAATKIVTVNSLPGSISGAGRVCDGATTTLTVTSGSGVWSSSNPSIASIGSGTGIVTGVYAGTATITFSQGAGCEVTRTMTVDPLPAGITGASNVCIGGTSTLSTASSGGVWSSGATGIATIGPSSGIVTGVSGGSATISYTVTTTGCASTYNITVITVPALTGLTNLCAWGDTVTVYNSNPAGTYSSSLVTVLNLGGGAGRVTAFAPGTGYITYTLAGVGCSRTTAVTVNTLPGLIAGTTNLCAGSAATLSNSVSGGVWSSGATSVATIGSSSGLLTGVGAGSTYIRYTIPNGCTVDTIAYVSVFPVVGTITGVTDICAGDMATLTMTGGGSGLWSSGAAGVATIGPATGVVTGVSAGTATISYAVTNVCGMATATWTMTINPIPDAGVITGVDSLCVGSVSTLSNIVVGGVWSTVNGNATIAATGVVTGVIAGMDTVVYTVTSAEGCVSSAVYVVKVKPWGLCGALASPQPSPGERELLRVWPNPARDELYVENAMGCEVRIYNMLGQPFDGLTMTSDKAVLNISRLTPGVYVVEVVGAMCERVSKRLIVER